MKSKHKFTPDQVVPMEERALLSHFPAALGPVTTLHLKGAVTVQSPPWPSNCGAGRPDRWATIARYR
jgi:hypothetical protein